MRTKLINKNLTSKIYVLMRSFVQKFSKLRSQSWSWYGRSDCLSLLLIKRAPGRHENMLSKDSMYECDCMRLGLNYT